MNGINKLTSQYFLVIFEGSPSINTLANSGLKFLGNSIFEGQGILALRTTGPECEFLKKIFYCKIKFW